MKDHFDAVIVGCGPAGASAAYTMAKGGLKTIVFERGKYPGSKNAFGGTIYSHSMQEILPAFWEDAPIERKVIREDLWLMDNNSALQVGFTGLDYAKEPYNKMIVALCKGKIEDRFNLEKDEGHIVLALGYPPLGKKSYYNKRPGPLPE